MSERTQMRELRMEMLRMRAEVERAEVASSVRELQGGARRLRTFAGFAGSIGAALGSRRDTLGMIATAVSGRPWLAAAAVASVRALKRRPLLAAVVVAAVVAGLRFTRRAEPRDGDPPS